MATLLERKLEENPMIAACNENKISLVKEASIDVVFLLNANIFNLKKDVSELKEAGKFVFVHVDLLDGFSKDKYAIKYIAEYIKPDGIISTKSNIIKIAKSLGFLTIQRLFIPDSQSFDTGLNNINTTKPDAIEIMPGIIPSLIQDMSKKVSLPIIAGGLVNSKEQVIQSLKAGAYAVSTSNNSLWEI